MSSEGLSHSGRPTILAGTPATVVWGGTSASTPLMAGILSLANQTRFNAGKAALTTVYSQTPMIKASPSYTPPAGHVQTHLYKVVYPNATKNAANLGDVTVGLDAGSSQKSASVLALYHAGAGYDVPTGLGAPRAAKLCQELLNA